MTARFQDYASILSRVDWRTDWSVSSKIGGAFRIQAEWTGWGLEALANNRNWAANESGQFLLGNIPFAHYFRTEAEWIWERKESQKKGTSWHGRLRGGWAVNGANFNGIIKIAVGFTFKVDYGKSSKIMLKLRSLRRRQNGVHQTSVSAVPNGKILKANFNLDKIWLDATVKNNGTFKAAIFKICCISPAPAIFHLWRPSL